MSVQNTGAVAITAPAPIPSVGGGTHPYNRAYFVTLERRTYCGTLNDIISDAVQGCGTIMLHELSFIFKCTDAKQSVYVGTCSSSNSQPLTTLGIKPNGVTYTSTAYNYGEKLIIKVVPADNLSMQIKPIPSDRPSIQLQYAISEGVEAMIVLYANVIGIQETYLTLNSLS